MARAIYLIMQSIHIQRSLLMHTDERIKCNIIRTILLAIAIAIVVDIDYGLLSIYPFVPNFYMFVLLCPMGEIP